MHELFNILGLIIFFATTYFSYFYTLGADFSTAQLFFLALLIAITIIRTIILASRLLFSPTSKTFRILPIQCDTAGRLHSTISFSAVYIVMSLTFTVVSKKLGAQPVTVSLLQLSFASLLLVFTAGLILWKKNSIRQQILIGNQLSTTQDNIGRKLFASLWHIFALGYLFILWILLINDVIDPSHKHRGAFLLSFFVLPIWIVLEKIMQWLVQYSLRTLKIYKQHYPADDVITEEDLKHKLRGQQIHQNMLLLSRFGLTGALLFWIASLWGITIPYFSNLTSVLLDTIIILTIALVFWQFVSNWIERKIAESEPEEESNKNEDDEWGSAAARGRSYTLLPMIRRFIATVLVTMVTMTILSSTGVDIGPLLAGAGVVGLAVGFGAQKLVADMFSGFFYLLDDAFRVGEYIEAGGLSGTVENISLRNVMLRHHRGMLQIVPHSELGAITNYMRGGIIVKFNLDFPYDAEIDKIRKIIKKVGQAMLQDEEFGDDFIRPVKSQGVREITNSVMTIRVKFTAKPGAHFVIRREAYKRITEALRAKGIDYAHRKVIVDIPQQENGVTNDPNLAKQLGGAASEEIISQTDQENNRGAATKPFPGM